MKYLLILTVMLITWRCDPPKEEPPQPMTSIENMFGDMDTLPGGGMVSPLALKIIPYDAFVHATKDTIERKGFAFVSQDRYPNDSTGNFESIVTDEMLLAWLRDSISGEDAQTITYSNDSLTIENGNTIVITGFADSTLTADTLFSHLTRQLANEAAISVNVDSLGTHRTEITSLNDYRGYMVDNLSDIASFAFPLQANIQNRETGARYVVSNSPVSGYATDGVAVIATGSNYAILQADQGFFDVKYLGAISDDNNEDTEAFSKATKFASINGEGIKSNGLYTVDSFNLLSGVTLDNTGGIIEQLGDSVKNYPMIHATGVVAIKGGEIRGAKTYFTDNNVTSNRLLKYLVNIDGGTKVTIDNVKFEKSTATALRVINSFDLTVSNCTFEDIGFDATTVINAIYMGGYYLERAKILGCYFYHVGWDYDIAGVSDADAIQILGANGDTYKEIRYIDIANNHFQGIDNRCIKMQDGYQVHISNNVADSANMFFSAAMADTVSNVTIIGNDIYNVTESFSAGSGNVELAIDFNIINNTMSNVYRALNSSDSSFYVNLHFKGNVVHNSEYTIRTKGRRIYVYDNYFESNGFQAYPFVFSGFTANSKNLTSGDYILKGNDFYTSSTLNNVLSFGSVKLQVIDNTFYYPTSSSSGFFNASTTTHDSSVVKGNSASFIQLPTFLGAAASTYGDKIPSLIVDNFATIGTSTQQTDYKLSMSGINGIYATGSGSQVIGILARNTTSTGHAGLRSLNNNNKYLHLFSMGSASTVVANGADDQVVGADNDLYLIGGISAAANSIYMRPDGWSNPDVLKASTSEVEVYQPFKLVSLTTTQRDALTPENGYMIYNTTTNQIEGYENGAWVDL